MTRKTTKRPSSSPRAKKTTGIRSRPGAPKRAKPRRKPTRRTGANLWAFAIVITLCLLIGFFMARWVFPPTPPPPKAPPVSLSKKIRLVDLTLQSQFYMLGLSEEEVVARKSVVRKKGDKRWTEKTTKIQLSKPIPFGRIVGYLDREIRGLGKEYSVAKKRETGDVLELDIRVDDLRAHHVVFYAPRVAKPEKPIEGRIAIVIDDLGYDRQTGRALLRLDAPLSFSVFPFAPHSRELAMEASEEGRDVLLHLPMEPKGYPGQNPGEGRLLTTMGEKQLLAQLDRDLSAVPYVKGVNNHMGSKFTENSELMRIVLKDIGQRGLFFLDSRTTPHTVGFRVAQELGIKTGQRSVFLDNDRDVAKIKTQLAELVALSKKNGHAIGIGHPHPETLRALREALPSLRDNGIEVVPVSMLLE